MAQQGQAGKAADGEAGMAGAFRIARLLGFNVYIHWSWLFIFALSTWSLATGYLPDVYPEWDAGRRWIVGGITSVLFFASVLAHELSHSVEARRRGIPVQGITLFIFGGVSALGGEARRPRDEFWIAFVGPLMSFALAGAFALIWLAARSSGATNVQAICGYLAYINVTLGIFNLLPGFPLDGGRVLRSLVWARNGNMLRATKVAANAGRVVAGLLVLLGILSLFGGNFGGGWFLLIGWFLWNAAESAYEQQRLESRLHGLSVDQLYEHETPRIPPTATLRQLAHDFILRQHRRAFFVVPEGEGRVLGLVTLSDLKKTPEDEWDRTTVERAMTPRDRLQTVTPRTDAMTAMQAMVEHNINQLPVLDDGRAVGLLSRAALLQAVQVGPGQGR